MNDQDMRERWIDQLNAVRIPDARLARIFQHPVKNARIAWMRATGRQAAIRADTFWGGQFHGVIPEAVSSLVWRFGLYEKSTTAFLLKYLPAGGCFVDIGAHFGYFSLLASRLVGASGRVVAIEAMPATFGYLSANIEANRADNVTAFNVAAAAEVTTLQFRDFGVVNSSLNSSGAARGVLAGRDAPHVTVDVEARPADAILSDVGVTAVDVLKIDAESSEEFVLAGLPATLGAESAPFVLIELGGGDAAEDRRSRDIVAWMAERRYDAHVFVAGRLHPIEVIGHFPYANIVFARSDRLKRDDLGELLRLSGDGAFA